jgi:hypothetical protein
MGTLIGSPILGFRRIARLLDEGVQFVDGRIAVQEHGSSLAPLLRETWGTHRLAWTIPPMNGVRTTRRAWFPVRTAHLATKESPLPRR